jgi:hypothetical protein
MANKVDLNKLSQEIANRKAEKGIIPQRLGEATGNFKKNSDEFLNGLLISLNTGKSTPSTKLLMEVDEKVAIKNGEKPRAKLPTNNNNGNVNSDEFYRAPVKSQQFDEMERDEQMFNDLNKRRQRTLAESIGEFTNPGQTAQQQQPRQTSNYNQPMSINEGALVENITNTVNNYLAESLIPMLEESTRNVIVEMYAAEKLKTVLYENKEMIKTLVLEVIREIQAKQKAKQQ